QPLPPGPDREDAHDTAGGRQRPSRDEHRRGFLRPRVPTDGPVAGGTVTRRPLPLHRGVGERPTTFVDRGVGDPQRRVPTAGRLPFPAPPRPAAYTDGGGPFGQGAGLPGPPLRRFLPHRAGSTGSAWCESGRSETCRCLAAYHAYVL